MSESLDELIGLEEEELLQKLGQELSHYQALPFTPKQLVLIAKNWLRGNSQKISEKICTSEKIYKLANSENVRKQLILAVCDLLLSLELPVSPLLVATLIVKGSLNEICKTYWTSLR